MSISMKKIEAQPLVNKWTEGRIHFKKLYLKKDVVDTLGVDGRKDDVKMVKAELDGEVGIFVTSV